jgi:hypothetical protein
MGVDSSYGSGAVRSASSSASRANATRAAANRKKSGARTAAARAKITSNIRNAPNDTPFKGLDPLSVVGRALWGTSGRVADVVTGRRTLDRNQQDEVGAIFASAALTVAGIYAATRRSAPARIRGTTGAVPMTTAQRSAAVTRAGRAGVGYIGTSIKPRAPRYDQEGGDYPGIATEPFSSYDSAYSRAESLYRQKYQKQSSPRYLEPVNSSKYKGLTETVTIADPFTDNDWSTLQSVDYDMITGAVKKTVDSRRAPLRKLTPRSNGGR